MRMLLLINNRQMGLRERYTTVLDSHAGGWITSFMSGMPGDLESIASGYNAVIFELGDPNSEERIAAVKRLRLAGVSVVTHLEGRVAATGVSELAAVGAVLVQLPVTSEHIQSALDTLMLSLRTKQDAAPRLGVRGFFRRWLGGT